MRKILLLILLNILVTSCDSDPKVEDTNSEYSMHCEKVNKELNTYRCENQEVVCYAHYLGYRSGISCKFRQTTRSTDENDPDILFFGK